jgi:hypothetical protein
MILENTMRNTITICLVVFFIMTPNTKAGNVADFENLTLPPESYWNGSDESGGFSSGDSYFINNYNKNWGSWDGWAYSNMTDNTTPAWSNQYSAYTGAAHSGSIYGVSYDPGTGRPRIDFAGDAYNAAISGAYFTNTAYAALSMLNGDSFSKKFGGADGSDPDWFLLTIKGLTESGYTSKSIEFRLADYRFTDDSQDYIVDEWTWVDLSSLGNITGLEFSLSSSDAGEYGMNTPAYFAMDTLSVPEPAAFILLGIGGIILRNRRS